MTNREAVIFTIGLPGYNDGAVDKAIIDNAIASTEDYTAGNAMIVTKAALQVLQSMLGIASIQEGGYSVQYSIEKRISALQASLGISAQPTLRNKSYLW